MVATHWTAYVYRDSLGRYRSLSCEVVKKRWFLGSQFVGEGIPQILDMHFQITSTSDHVASFGWVLFQWAGRVGDEKRRNKKERNNKRLCYCRGTVWRATSVEILWPFLTELLTRSSADAEEPCEHTCQLKSCKMPHKCSTDCIWKRLQAVNYLQGHSRSLPLLPFDRPYTISY